MEEPYNTAPLYDALVQYVMRRDISFHVPGHKDGVAFHSLGEMDHLLTSVMKIDVTEISGIDDLHHPEGVIQLAQEQAADFFGADETFFLVGGSTVGNLALILTVCSKPGDIVLVQRNVHKSVIHGLMLAGAQAVFLAPQMDEMSGLPTIPSLGTVQRALDYYPEAKGVLITHPNYYGMGTTITPLSDLCHQYGIPLLVDEAHGAHYGLHKDVPPSALSAGADGVVQSTHKMLCSLTMSAMLHVQGEWIDRRILRQRLTMVQSSSPSYPLMASLDLSRSILQSQGECAFEEGLDAAALLRSEIEQHYPRMGIIHPKSSNSINNDNTYLFQDPFKVVMYDKLRQWSGYELQSKLESYGCIPEMSDDRYVVLALSLGTTEADVRRLLLTLQWINENEPVFTDCDHSMSSTTEVSTWNINIDHTVSEPVIFGMTSVTDEEATMVDLEKAEGEVAADMIVPYPPGIPLLYPGERITPATAASLDSLRIAKAKCHGATDPTLQKIRIYRSGE